MPFQSEKQRRYLWANEPEIARDWTDTYGSRISRDNGGIMQGGVQNFLGQQPTVNAPKYWQSAPGHEMTELAYITPRERDTLVDMDMYGTMRGGPNEGPSGIMSLNGWGSTDPSQERAGADMPDSSSGQGWDAPTFQPSGGPSYSTAKSPAELKLLSERKGGDTVLSSGMRNQLGMPAAQKRRGFNPFRFLGGAFKWPGRIASGIMGFGKDWASNMRGGMTQQEWEQAKQERIANKRIQNILGRDAPITDMTIKNLAGLGYTGEMPGIGSTGTSRAIDRDVSMQDVLRERPFSANRLQEIQRGWNNQDITQAPASEYEGMWDNRGINQTRSALDFLDPNLATSTAEIYKEPWTKRIGEQQGINLEEAGALKLDPKLKGMEWLDQPIDWETAGAMGAGNAAKRKMMKANPDMTWREAANMARENKLPFGYTFALNPALKELDYGGKEGPFYGGITGEVEPQFESLVGGKGRGFLNIADPSLKDQYYEDLQKGGYYDEAYENYIRKHYPKTLTGHKGTGSKGLIEEDKWSRDI